MSKKILNKILPNHLGIYIRVSTDKQVDSGISLRDQKERGINYATLIGWSFEIFEDAGLSGTLSSKDRPRYYQLMEMVDSGKIGGIWVVDIDRLTRTEDGQVLISSLKLSGVKIIENGVEKNLMNPDVEAMVRIKSIFASYEVQKMSERIRKSLEKNARDGKVSGGPIQPYGYKKENKILVINEDESEIVKRIFKLSLDGLGTRVIAGILNDEGIPTKRSGELKGYLEVRGKRKTTFKWKDAVVYHILTNSLYKGLKKYKNLELESPIIIEPNVFDIVQQNLSIKNRFKKDKKYFYLLKGLVYCGDPNCRGSFYGRKREDLSDNQYCCISSRDKKGFCGNRGISIDKLDVIVWEQVKDLEPQINKFFKWYEKTDQIKNVKREYDILSNHLKKLNDEYGNLIVMGAKGNIKVDIIETQVEIYNQKINKLENRLSELSPQLTILDNKETIKNIVRVYIERIKKEDINDEEKQKIVRSLIDRIYIKWNDNTGVRPSPIPRPKHQIKIYYKIDALSSFKLINDLEIGYDKMGWRYDNIGTLKNELIIKQEFTDIVSAQKWHGFNPVSDIIIK